MAGDMAKEYSNIEFESMIVDNASMQLVRTICFIDSVCTRIIVAAKWILSFKVKRPQQFDIMLMPNLYGNIISNIAYVVYCI